MRSIRGPVYAAALAGVVALLVVPAAWAGTIKAGRAGNVVTITSTSETQSEEVRMTIRGGNLTLLGGAFGTNTDVDANAGCTDLSAATDVHCGNGASVQQIVIRPRGGDDTFQARTLQAGDVADLQALIDADMGPGDDLLAASENSQRVVATGGDGSDGFFSGSAADRLEGGPGNDRFGAGFGSDELLGGADFDNASYGGHDGNLTLDLDGQRDDGDPALGEADLLDSIESLQGGDGDDVITGDGGINDLQGGDGSDRIDGRGGFDRLAGDFEGSGDGNDTIIARDGLADTISCAGGFDIAFTDDIDSAFGCEDRQSIPDLQPDRDGDGIDKPLDCDDLDGTVRPGAFDRPGDGVDQDCDGADAIDDDRDRDGFVLGVDCDDGRRGVHPGAREVLGNARDEDCDGVADPFAAFPTEVLLSARLGPVTRVVGLVLVDLDGRERVRVSCKGNGCRFKPRRVRARRDADVLILDKQVRGLRLRPGMRVVVRMTRADGVRKLVTFTARAGKPPGQSRRCVAPRGGRVAAC